MNMYFNKLQGRKFDGNGLYQCDASLFGGGGGGRGGGMAVFV